MGLSAADVTFINRAMDRHLRRQASWAWMRVLLLAVGILLVAFGAAVGSRIPALDRLMRDNTAEVRQTTPEKGHDKAAAREPATRAVTHEELLAALQASDRKAEMESRNAAMIGELHLVGLITVMLNVLVGCFLIFYTLTRWNNHRRDAILIMLLREKCKGELG